MKKSILLSTLLTLATSCNLVEKPDDNTKHGISGTVSITPELSKRIKPNDFLYVIARGTRFGPPLAVKRYDHIKFPIAYQIGPKDAMLPRAEEGFKSGELITISARVSSTGRALPTNGDLEGRATRGSVKSGSTDVDIVINREFKTRP